MIRVESYLEWGPYRSQKDKDLGGLGFIFGFVIGVLGLFTAFSAWVRQGIYTKVQTTE